ncbi:MAG: amidohydrolase family protein [Actinobacteria bacterium]|nr:amidohydrolase family protein [Actinomycetota bacterium]
MRTLIRGGTVVSLDPAIGELDFGDVLIDGETIVEVARHINAPDAAVIDATDRIVMPGFVDTHRHTWQTAFRGVGADWTFAQYLAAVHGTLKPHYEPEDVYLGNLMGRLEALHSGVTTLVDWFHCGRTPEHVDAAIQALRDAPGRSVFCYGACWGTTERVGDEIRRARTAVPGTGLVTMAWGLRGPELIDMDLVAEELALAVDLGLRTSVHIETGGRQRPIADLHARGLLSSTTTFVHVNNVGDDEVRMLADAGCSVSISPDVELKMGIGWPMTGRMLGAGLRPSLSTDDAPSAGGDMFATMRSAHVAQRGLDGSLNARDILEFATIDGAAACGLAEHTGTLSSGMAADVILLNANDPTVFPFNNPAGTIVASGHPGLVETVLVAGRVVKREGHLIDVDLPTLRTRLRESRDAIAAAAGVALDGTWHPGVEAN